MNVNNLKTTYDINSSCPPCRTVVSHDCDVNTRTVEVCFCQGMIPLVISQDCTAKAAFVERQSNVLINDNVACTVTERGSVLIPVDNLHRQGRFDMNIELTVTNQGGEKVLVTPFPMWITVNGSILNEAEVTEESKGTVPDLLEEAAEALAEAKDYENLDNLPAINGHELVGNKTGDSLGLQNKLTAGENITIDENNRISAQGGSNNYNDLSNRPQIGFTGRRVTLENTLNFYFGDFTGQALPSGVMISLRENVFKSVLSPTGYILYNFNVIASNLLLTGVYKIRKVDVTNLPQEFSNAGQILYVFHYLTNKTYSDLIRMVAYEMADGVKVWIQLATLGGADESGNTLVNTSTAWTDLTTQIGYILTEQDKQDIADLVLAQLPTTQGVQYGNTSN